MFGLTNTVFKTVKSTLISTGIDLCSLYLEEGEGVGHWWSHYEFTNNNFASH